MSKLKFNSLSSTLALTVISLATLTSSVGVHLDSQMLESESFSINEIYVNNANSSDFKSIPLNSSKISYGTDNKIHSVLVHNISMELFGKMRHLTRDESVKKMNMYRNMSTVVDGMGFFD